MHEERNEDKIPCEDILHDEERGRLVFNRGLIIRHPISFLRSLGPLLTAHHPHCSKYEKHIFTFRRRQWCIGCFFNSLSFFLALGFLIVGWLVFPLAISRFYLFWGGVAFTIISFAMSGFGLTDSKPLKVLSKIILGAAFACITWAIIIADGLDAHIETKAVTILSLYLFLVFIMAIRRTLEIENVCKECDYQMRWSKCPGFETILCPLIEQNFLRPEVFQKSEDE